MIGRTLELNCTYPRNSKSARSVGMRMKKANKAENSVEALEKARWLGGV